LFAVAQRRVKNHNPVTLHKQLFHRQPRFDSSTFHFSGRQAQKKQKPRAIAGSGVLENRGLATTQKLLLPLRIPAERH
jgi:hypothetical protein